PGEPRSNLVVARRFRQCAQARTVPAAQGCGQVVSNPRLSQQERVGYAALDTNVTGRRKSMQGPVPGLLGATWVLLVAAPLLLAPQVAPAQTYAVTTKPNVEYVVHDGVKLTGDFYLPKGLDKAPVIVAVHGGGWQAGSPDSLNVWAPFMARNGYAVFAIRYRLAKPGAPTYPAVVYDVKSAVQFVRAKAADFSLDPARVALAGASAGAHLASLAGHSA